MKVTVDNLKNSYSNLPVEIDYSIVDLILKFNRLGYSTFSCCSGLPEDHPDDSDDFGFYIIFITEPPKNYRKIAVDLGFDSITFTWWNGKENIKLRDILWPENKFQQKNTQYKIKRLIHEWEKMLDEEIFKNRNKKLK